MQSYNAFVFSPHSYIHKPMEIAIVSDIHDNLKHLNTVLDLCKSREIEHIICCGDLCAPFVISALGESGLNVYVVFGNNDGDRFNMTKLAQEYPNIRIYGEYIGDEDNILIFDSVRIGVSHYPFYAKTMVKTGWYDAVFYGHSHTYEKQKFGKALLLNPGEVAGIFNAPSFAVYDTEFRGCEKVEIG